MANTCSCLTVLLVYASVTSIALVIVSGLLATAHKTAVVCKGDEELIEITHDSALDSSYVTVEENEVGKVTCNCGERKLLRYSGS